MKLKDIKDVLTFASFRPEPDDTTAGWPKRFPRERTLMLNITKTGVSWVGMERGLKIGDSGSLEGAVKDVAGQVGEEWKSLTDNGWCAVSLSTRYVISLESNLSRRKGAEEQIRTNPKIALGAKAERGKRYSVAHNSESNTSVLLAVEEDLVKRIEGSLDSADLKIGRVSCGPFAMLTDLIEQVAEARAAQKEGEGLGPIVMVACCQGSVVALTQQGDSWTELRSPHRCLRRQRCHTRTQHHPASDRKRWRRYSRRLHGRRAGSPTSRSPPGAPAKCPSKRRQRREPTLEKARRPLGLLLPPNPQ